MTMDQFETTMAVYAKDNGLKMSIDKHNKMLAVRAGKRWIGISLAEKGEHALSALTDDSVKVLLDACRYACGEYSKSKYARGLNS